MPPSSQPSVDQHRQELKSQQRKKRGKESGEQVNKRINDQLAHGNSGEIKMKCRN